MWKKEFLLTALACALSTVVAVDMDASEINRDFINLQT